MSDRLKKEVQHFQELSTSQAKRIEKLEEELIKHESLMEQRQVLLSESYQLLGASNMLPSISSQLLAASYQ